MRARIRRFALAGLVLTATAAPVSGVGAQPPAAADVTARQEAAPAGPTIEAAAIGARGRSQEAATLNEAVAAMQQRLGLGQARALMIVGFAAFIIGLLMNNDPGTFIAVVGAGVGLYGLYHYLK